MLVVVCGAQAGFAKKKPPLHPINLNTASSAELQQVPGIGPSTAGKILEMRKSYGAFKSVDDLRAIKGSGPKKLDKVRKYLSVGKPAQSKQGATSAQAKAPPGKSAVGAKPVPAQKKSIEPQASEEEEP